LLNLLAGTLLGVAQVQPAQVAPTSATPAVDLSPAERQWLAEKHTVRARVSDYPPYMISKPAPAGMSVEYLAIIAKRIGFQMVFVPAAHGWPESMQDVMGPHQHYDLLLTMNRTPEREQQFALTADYLTAPWVIYTRNDSPYYSGLTALSRKTVASEKGYVITGKLKADYPAIRLLEVDTSTDALLAVSTGQADAYLGNLANANYLIRANRLHNLIVAAPTPFGSHTQAMAVRKDWQVLAGLIDKGIAAMTREERSAIDQKWGVVEFRKQIDYTLVWQIVAGAGLLLLAFFFWNRRLAREIALRHQTDRHRYRCGSAGAPVHCLRTDRQQHDTQVRRHRARPGDQQAPGRDDGRRDRRREPCRPGQYLLVHRASGQGQQRCRLTRADFRERQRRGAHHGSLPGSTHPAGGRRTH